MLLKLICYESLYYWKWSSHLALANILIKKELIVDILSDNKNYRYDETRTLGISKSNVDYFNKEILNIEKILYI